MRFAFAGHGAIGERCRDILGALKVDWVDYIDAPEPYDILLSVHWPHKFTPAQLAIPKLGALNLHNSYLPWNRGAHACTWAIVDQTPHGATMHWMDREFDRGDIFLQRRIELIDGESADCLYHRTAMLEVELFRESIGMLLMGVRTHTKQVGIGSLHRKADFDRLVSAMTTSDCRVVRNV